MDNGGVSNSDVNTETYSKDEKVLAEEQKMTCEPKKQRDDPKKSMEKGVVAMASGEVENRDGRCVSKNKQPVVQAQSGGKEAKETDDNTANPTARNKSKEPTEEDVGVQDPFFQDANWQGKFEELKKELQDVKKEKSHLQAMNEQLLDQNTELREQNTQLREQNTELLGKLLSVNDLGVSGLEHKIDQLGPGENYETKNDERRRWLKKWFPSVHHPDSKPDFPRTSSECRSSCGRDATHLLLRLKGLNLCRERFNEKMGSALPLKDNRKSCSYFVQKLDDLGMARIVSPDPSMTEPNPLKLENLDAALKAGMNALSEAGDDMGLVYVHYSNSNGDGHYMLMLKIDPDDESFAIYDQEKEDWWPKSDENAQNVDKIKVVKLITATWISSCSLENCYAERSPAMPV